jgi:hypothetical protein
LGRWAYTPITRQLKVKGTANPYDPAWESYFETRLGVKMANTLRGRRRLRDLWREQHGICPVCEQPITTITGWHNHHIVWRTHGGSDHRAVLRGRGDGNITSLPDTHYWGLSRRGKVRLKRKTSKKRLRRALVAINQWLR